jgi:hypothetical protein
MPVISVHVFYVGTSAYDLRKVSSAVQQPSDLVNVYVRFIDEPRSVLVFDAATFIPAWTASLNATTGGSSVITGGDLSGPSSNATVIGIRGVPVVATTPTAGQTLIYNALTNSYQPALSVRYFVSGAAAQAAAPFINGTLVIIYPGSPTSTAGTWQVAANQGAAFPADYTKLSDLTDTASEVGIVDVGSYYPGSTNVEQALQQLGSGVVSGPSGVIASNVVPTNTIIDTYAVGYVGADYDILLTNGVLAVKTKLAVAHNGTLVTVGEYGTAPGPGVGVLPITFSADILAGNVRIIATSAALASGWSYRLRRVLLAP